MLLRDHRLGRLICRAPFHLARRSSLALPPVVLFSFPLVFLSTYVRPRASRLSVSSSPSRRASRLVLFRCVVSSRRAIPSCRLACSSRRFAYRLVLSARVIPSARSVCRLGLSVSYGRRSVLLFARSCSPIRFRFMSSVVGRGRVVMAMGRGSCRLIYSLVAGWLCGRMRHEAPFRVARRSFLGVYGSSFFSSHRFLIARIACSCPIIHKARKRRDGWRRQMAKADGEGQTRKTRRLTR